MGCISLWASQVSLYLHHHIRTSVNMQMQTCTHLPSCNTELASLPTLLSRQTTGRAFSLSLRIRIIYYGSFHFTLVSEGQKGHAAERESQSREGQTQLESRPPLPPPPRAYTASCWHLAFSLGSKVNACSNIISHISYFKGEALVNYACLDLVQHRFQQMAMKSFIIPTYGWGTQFMLLSDYNSFCSFFW